MGPRPGASPGCDSSVRACATMASDIANREILSRGFTMCSFAYERLQGSLFGRSSQRLASGSPMISSFTGSHRNGRLSQ